MRNKENYKEIEEFLKEMIFNIHEKYTLTLAEASKLSGINVNTLREIIRSDNTFPYFRNGVKVVIPRKPLIEWIDKQAIEHREVGI
ncbi:MAG: helix-turn-helix domain-containing protein [Romboutsia sp.]|nr:helix-turn-helix domain-containing protein [Romboutsia sp.]